MSDQDKSTAKSFIDAAESFFKRKPVCSPWQNTLEKKAVTLMNKQELTFGENRTNIDENDK